MHAGRCAHVRARLRLQVLRLGVQVAGHVLQLPMRAPHVLQRLPAERQLALQRGHAALRQVAPHLLVLVLRGTRVS
jgi:hypothetical protein